MMLQRVRVKARSTEAMEMNGHVNREVDWGACAAWSAIFSLFLSAEGRAQSYLSHSEISNRTAIHHWLTCYWSPLHPLFSTKLYYKKRITNVCTIWVVHTFVCLSRIFWKKKKNPLYCVMFVRHVKQSYSENLVVFSRWQVLYRFKPTQTLKRGQFLLELLVIYSWHLSHKHCRTCWYKHQLVNVSEVKCMPSTVERVCTYCI